MAAGVRIRAVTAVAERMAAVGAVHPSHLVGAGEAFSAAVVRSRCDEAEAPRAFATVTKGALGTR